MSRYLSSADADGLAFGRNVPFAYSCLRVGMLESLFIITKACRRCLFEYVAYSSSLRLCLAEEKVSASMTRTVAARGSRNADHLQPPIRLDLVL